MIVRDVSIEKNTDRKVADQRWNSVRLLLADDGMGFSFHITTIEGGSAHTFHYKNHFESVYCISGEGEIEDLATGEVHQITPGVMYALNLHDRHTLRARKELVLACCFTPPVTGNEVHQADGSYAAAAK
ncbi:MAG: ectoine synthase [Pseudorhodobacter sp.]|nr:ectoine synthase [Pseudorhodobacter sp.]